MAGSERGGRRGDVPARRDLPPAPTSCGSSVPPPALGRASASRSSRAADPTLVTEAPATTDDQDMAAVAFARRVRPGPARSRRPAGVAPAPPYRSRHARLGRDGGRRMSSHGASLRPPSVPRSPCSSPRSCRSPSSSDRARVGHGGRPVRGHRCPAALGDQQRVQQPGLRPRHLQLLLRRHRARPRQGRHHAPPGQLEGRRRHGPHREAAARRLLGHRHLGRALDHAAGRGDRRAPPAGSSATTRWSSTPAPAPSTPPPASRPSRGRAPSPSSSTRA